MAAKTEKLTAQASGRLVRNGSASRISNDDRGTRLSDDEIRRWFLRDPNTELREQLRRTVCTIVALSIVRPGDAVPGIKRVARVAEIYPSALAFVYSSLEQDGVLRGEQGRGFFVVDPQVARSELAAQLLGHAIHSSLRLGLKDTELVRVFRSEIARRAVTKGE